MSPLVKCGVCEDDTHPISYYGAIVCNPCRTFFRRQVLQSRVRRSDNLPLLLAVEGTQPLKCKSLQQCLLSGHRRKKCGWCRFQKCLAIGMKPDLVKTSEHVIYQMKYEMKYVMKHGEISNSRPLVFKSASLPEKQQYPMCFDASLVPSQQLYWNEDTADVTSYFCKQDFRHVTPLSWQQLPSLGPPKNFWLKKPAGLSVEYTLIDVMMTPGTDYYMTVDVQGEALTSFEFSDNFSATARSSFDFPATALIMTSIQGCYVFQRQSDSLAMPIFDVQIISENQSNSSKKQAVMKSLTERHWKHLQEMTKAYKIWESVMTVHVSDVNPTDSHEPRSHKRLSLSATTDSCSNNFTRGIYSLETIEGICLEDQVIVAKEAYFALAALLYIHTFVRHENAFVLYSPETRDVLQMCIHIDSNRADFSSELYDMYCNFLKVSYDFLRVDPVVIALLSLLFVYNDVPGLSCNKVFKEERSVYTELLDMYIDAKVESKEWKLSKDQIWDHIGKLMTQLTMAKPIYVKFSQQLQEAIEKSHE